MSDDRGRKTITDFLGDRAERLFHVGRLDYDTEGLMLLTNDGELAHRLAHPSYEVAKTYLGRRARPGPPRPGTAAARPASSSRTGWRSPTSSGCSSRPARAPWWRSRCTRAASTSSAGCSPRSATRSAACVRTTVGPIKLGGLRPGATRDLTTKEIGELYAAVGL